MVDWLITKLVDISLNILVKVFLESYVLMRANYEYEDMKRVNIWIFWHKLFIPYILEFIRNGFHSGTK